MTGFTLLPTTVDDVGWQDVDDSQTAGWQLVSSVQVAGWQLTGNPQPGDWTPVADSSAVVWVHILT